ncbi:MAG: ribonuclease inhibitor, partial [Cytophagales bacterium]|nr:ribonuclease inhibitor [Cytophagales bacterium]
PQPIRGWVGMEARAEAAEGGAIIPKIDNIQQAIVYQQLVQPVLKQKCWSCHNAEKQKGKLRMDTPEFLMTGGEDGVIIKAGMPLESEMIKRLLMDASEEHHMPPKGKTPFTEDEIAVLQWWVQHGADFKKKVVALPADAKIKTILAKYASGTSATEPYWSPVFKLSISEADEDDMKGLRKLGLLVNPAAKDQAFLEVNAVNAHGLADKELSELSSVQEQIVQLKLGQTKVTDGFMPQIADMPILIQLDLDHTNISDKGMVSLENLKYLESLNLYGTQVSDAAILSLAKIKSLKRVFLWQSKFTEAGVAKLKKMRPGLTVDFGFKGKWPLEIDTVRVEEKAK